MSEIPERMPGLPDEPGGLCLQGPFTYEPGELDIGLHYSLPSRWHPLRRRRTRRAVRALLEDMVTGIARTRGAAG